ncbi:MAG TPA: hypothetical protein VJ454_02170, partial [Steroidobacteraceae bacterium]|nr:hypothetical protein [Steroidobacteraceae bacterium]
LSLVACAVVIFGFYWLMQPTVVTNYGMSAYKAPPKAVVVYADEMPKVLPPAPAEPVATAAVAEPAPPIAETVAPQKETKKREARTTAPEARTTAARRERSAREQQNTWNSPWGSNQWGNNQWASRPGGSRPWF